MSKKKNGKGEGAKVPAEAKRFILGRSQIFTPEVINDIHVKSELGRYRMRGFSLFKKIPHWDDLTFLPGTLTRFVIEGYREKCDTKTVIGPKAKRPVVLDISLHGGNRPRFWLVAENGADPSLCIEDPKLPQERYVFIEAAVAALVPLARGTRDWRSAITDGSVELFGDPGLIRRLPDWFVPASA